MNRPAETQGAERRRDIIQQAGELRHQLREMREKLTTALPPGVPVERFNSVVMLAIQQKPDLLLCERKSLLLAVMRCAVDGLLPDGRDATIAIYNDNKRGEKTAQFMPMLYGILKRARNSGQIASVSAAAVYENDTFDYELGDREFIRHRPLLGDRGMLIGAYAIVRTKDGAIYRDVMDKHDIDRRRAASPAPDSPAWKDWYDEQAVKTVLRHCLKKAPQSSVLDRLLNTETIASPSNPAKELAAQPLPDPASRERTIFDLKCQALEAVRSAETEAVVEECFRKARGAFSDLGTILPVEIEAARNERLEVLRDAAAGA